MISQQLSEPLETTAHRERQRSFEVVIHIGYPKTASTWLQETIFSDPAAGFAFAGGKHSSRARTTAAFVTSDSFSDDSTWARSFFEDDLRRGEDGGLVPLISDECLCGDVLGQVPPGRYLADRLHSAFPSARIIIGIREQKAAAVSFYREYLLLYGTFSFEVYLGPGDEPLGFGPILHTKFLEYDRIVGYYQKLYGRENVLVLPIERLKKDREGYVRSILEFCQCPGRIETFSEPLRVGLSAAALEVRRLLNRLIRPHPYIAPPSNLTERVVQKLGRLVDAWAPKSWSAPQERRWKDIVARRYKGTFVESNRRLAELVDIDLGALGYDI